MMLMFVFCGIILSVTFDMVHCKCMPDYIYSSDASGWLKVHSEPATFDQATAQCLAEGAKLASPDNQQILDAMKLLMDPNSHYYLAMKFSLTQDTSVGGAAVKNMPIKSIVENLNSNVCLSMSNELVNVILCSTKLKYMCFKPHYEEGIENECGTFDKEYRLENTTGSCYKLHTKPYNWLEANSICMFEGGYLAVPNDVGESQILKNLFNKRIGLLGFRDWFATGKWLSVHGECLEWNWYLNEPYSGTGYTCGAMVDDGRLAALQCTGHSLQFICERDPNNIRTLSELTKHYSPH